MLTLKAVQYADKGVLKETFVACSTFDFIREPVEGDKSKRCLQCWLPSTTYADRDNSLVLHLEPEGAEYGYQIIYVMNEAGKTVEIFRH